MRVCAWHRVLLVSDCWPAHTLCYVRAGTDVCRGSLSLPSAGGDTRTLAIPVAHTIYYEMGAQRRASMGIADSMIRFSIGIEEIDDLLADFEKALA